MVTKMNQEEQEEQEEQIVKIPLRKKNGEIVAYTIVDKDVYDTINFTPCLNKDGYAKYSY